MMRLARPRRGLSSAMSARLRGRRRDFRRKVFRFEGNSAEEGAMAVPMDLKSSDTSVYEAESARLSDSVGIPKSSWLAVLVFIWFVNGWKAFKATSAPSPLQQSTDL